MRARLELLLLFFLCGPNDLAGNEGGGASLLGRCSPPQWGILVCLSIS